MESATVTRFMQLIMPLSTEMKLEILSKLSENLRADFHTKKDDTSKLLGELSGAWSETDDALAEEIINSRTTSNKNIGFD